MLRRPDVVRRLLVVHGVLVGGIVVLGGVGLVASGLVPAEPAPSSPPAIALLLFSIAVFSRLAERSRRTLVLTRRLGDLWVFVGVLWLAIALMCALLMPAWSIAWWFGHVMETLGFAAVGIPVALDLREGRAQSRPLSGDLLGADLVAGEEALLGPHVRALTQRLVAKDRSTEQHTRRVALLAVLVGEELGLPATRLRRLAIGGLLHDIGKLQVPDEILGKPAALSDEEFATIKCHPGWGDELAGELGFERSVRLLIRSHHERLDGRGYPDGLRADDVPLDVRVMTVCDVYDALTDDRVYRGAFPRDTALAIIEEDTPEAFDERCVAALRRVLDRGPDQDASSRRSYHTTSQ